MDTEDLIFSPLRNSNLYKNSGSLQQCGHSHGSCTRLAAVGNVGLVEAQVGCGYIFVTCAQSRRLHPHPTGSARPLPLLSDTPVTGFLFQPCFSRSRLSCCQSPGQPPKCKHHSCQQALCPTCLKSSSLPSNTDSLRRAFSVCPYLLHTPTWGAQTVLLQRHLTLTVVPTQRWSSDFVSVSPTQGRAFHQQGPS